MTATDNLPKRRCESELHSQHLCTLTDQYFHINEPDQYRAMVKGAEFKCQFCGRTAKDRENLCAAVDL